MKAIVMCDVSTGIIHTAESRMRIGGMEGLPTNIGLAALRVARISSGPISYIRATKVLEQNARKALKRSYHAPWRAQP